MALMSTFVNIQPTDLENGNITVHSGILCHVALIDLIPSPPQTMWRAKSKTAVEALHTQLACYKCLLCTQLLADDIVRSSYSSTREAALEYTAIKMYANESQLPQLARF